MVAFYTLNGAKSGVSDLGKELKQPDQPRLRLSRVDEVRQAALILLSPRVVPIHQQVAVWSSNRRRADEPAAPLLSKPCQQRPGCFPQRGDVVSVPAPANIGSVNTADTSAIRVS